jgi:hypothetical protein
MYEGSYRPRAEIEYRSRRDTPRRGAERLSPRMVARPDRIALWAVLLALAGMIAAAASAHAGSGGTGASGTSGGSTQCPDQRFGARSLRLGDCGDDVRTLHWVLKADSYGVTLDQDFDNPTDDSVRAFQRSHDVGTTGVVNRTTRRKLARTMAKATATWYGPGFYRKRTACGKRLTRSTIGVAHRRLPCGTKVTLKYKGRWVRAKVIDRGPYARGVRWDLTSATAQKLHMSTTSTIRAAPIK